MLLSADKMDNTIKPGVQTFSLEKVGNDIIYACQTCYADIFLESNILSYIPCDRAYFVKEIKSINITSGHNRNINCANCKSYLGKVIFHQNPNENELRLTAVIPKYIFR